MHKEIVFAAGVFDLFHIGHLNLLERARDLGSRLIVGVLSDDAAAAYKPRPVISFEQRVRIVAALKCVDEVHCQVSTDATELLKVVKPDILVHGSDHTPEWEIGQSWMKSEGRQFILLPYTSGISTRQLRQQWVGQSAGAAYSVPAVIEAGLPSHVSRYRDK